MITRFSLTSRPLSDRILVSTRTTIRAIQMRWFRDEQRGLPLPLQTPPCRSPLRRHLLCLVSPPNATPLPKLSTPNLSLLPHHHLPHHHGVLRICRIHRPPVTQIPHHLLPLDHPVLLQAKRYRIRRSKVWIPRLSFGSDRFLLCTRSKDRCLRSLCLRHGNINLCSPSSSDNDTFAIPSWTLICTLSFVLSYTKNYEKSEKLEYFGPRAVWDRTMSVGSFGLSAN